MNSRPKIKLHLSPLDKGLELASKILLFLMWLLAVYTFIKMPDRIPTHFDALGQPDHFGNKWTSLIMPILATFIFLGITKLNNYPHLFNYMRKITEENAAEQYTLGTRILRFSKLAVLLIFIFIILYTYLTTLGFTGIGILFIPLTFGLLLIPAMFIVFQSLPTKIK